MKDILACVVSCAQALTPGAPPSSVPSALVDPVAAVQLVRDRVISDNPVATAYWELRQEKIRGASYHAPQWRFPVPTLVLK